MKLFKRSAFILFICSGIGALACCMLPQTYKGSVSQDSQEALIIHANGREDLIIKVDPKIEGEGDLPYFAWIVSVPTEPDKYELADKSIFADIFKFSTDYLAPPPSRNQPFAAAGSDEDAFGGAPKDEGIVLGRKVTVGPYDIQPIRGVGENAFKGLNNWLTKNGFPVEPEAHMKYFVDNDFTFLCIKVLPAKGQKSLSKNPGLSPLKISFKSEQVYYPLKYSSQQGDFNLQLYVLSDKRLNYASNTKTLEKMKLEDYGYKRNYPLMSANKNLPKSLSKVLKTQKNKSWYMNDLRCRGFNKDKAIEKWDEDIFLTTSMTEADIKPFFDGLHCIAELYNVFGVADKLKKDEAGQRYAYYQLDSGRQLYLKKESRQTYQAVLRDAKGNVTKLKSLYINHKFLCEKLSSVLPRDKSGVIFFPDDVQAGAFPKRIQAACEAYLEYYANEAFDPFATGSENVADPFANPGEKTKDVIKAPVINSSKTFTRFQFLQVEFSGKKHFLIFSKERQKVIGRYLEISR